MSDFDPTGFVLIDGSFVSIDYAGIIAEMTGTDAADWEEVDGPESGVGVDYHYAHAAGATAYIVHDQERISISVTDAYGDEGESLAFDLSDRMASNDEELRTDP